MNVDVRTELEQFSWTRVRWSHDKLIAASPFRYDRNPSFMVRLEPDGDYPAGSWCDSGATDPEWTSGGIVKLLAFLRNETYEETRDYLLAKYSPEWDGESTLSLSVCLAEPVERNRHPLDRAILQPYRFRHPYLARRGIAEEVQRKMRIGYCKRSNAVTIPWFLPDGRLANVKYRRTDSKVFWYYSGGWPLRSLLYGIERVYKNRTRQAVLVEGEIDAMYCMAAGWPAIAIGGSAFTDEKAELIARSPLESVIIATDNDEVGGKIRDEVLRKLCGAIDLEIAEIPVEHKDVNDVKSIVTLNRIFTNARKKGIRLAIT